MVHMRFNRSFNESNTDCSALLYMEFTMDKLGFWVENDFLLLCHRLAGSACSHKAHKLINNKA